MTEYEKLSLALLSSIAQGISLQMTQLDIAIFKKGEVGEDLIDLLKKHATARESWQEEVVRLAQLAWHNHPDRFE